MSTVTASQLVVMKDALLSILSCVGAKRAPTPLGEVMQLLKAYIIKQRLYDCSQPMEILCGGDPLGSLFGVSSFPIKETFKYLARNLFRVPAQAVSQESPDAAPKREAPSTSWAEESASKRPCPPPREGPCASPTYLGVPGTPKYDSASETDCSIQGYETAYVKDTSDEYWYSDEKHQANGAVSTSLSDTSDTDSPYELEFEVESADEKDDTNCYSSASDIEDASIAGIVLCLEDEDCEFWADFSDFDSESSESVCDSEIGEDDLWQCRLCKTRNTPLQRYCQKCWRERFGWLPDRADKHPPQRKRYRKKKERLLGKRGVDEELVKQTASEESCPKEESSQDSCVGICNICLVRPKCGIIIHGRTSHRFTCYKCARQLLERNQPCPVCRRPIQRVTRNFDV